MATKKEKSVPKAQSLDFLLKQILLEKSQAQDFEEIFAQEWFVSLVDFDPSDKQFTPSPT